jgi:putative cell wall-binding protein
VTRLAGADRYATAAAISAATFPAGAPVAYVATGHNFPDALAGISPAVVADGPILLSDPNGVPAHTALELTRLRPGQIVVLGGPSVVSDEVLAALAAYTPGGVTRLAGQDRYATAAAASRATFAAAETVFVASGLDFPDALAGGSPAGVGGAPLLLVNPNALPAATASELARLGASRAVILGGPSVVSNTVAAQIGSLLAP